MEPLAPFATRSFLFFLRRPALSSKRVINVQPTRHSRVQFFSTMKTKGWAAKDTSPNKSSSNCSCLAHHGTAAVQQTGVFSSHGMCLRSSQKHTVPGHSFPQPWAVQRMVQFFHQIQNTQRRLGALSFSNFSFRAVPLFEGQLHLTNLVSSIVGPESQHPINICFDLLTSSHLYFLSFVFGFYHSRFIQEFIIFRGRKQNNTPDW